MQPLHRVPGVLDRDTGGGLTGMPSPEGVISGERTFKGSSIAFFMGELF